MSRHASDASACACASGCACVWTKGDIWLEPAAGSSGAVSGDANGRDWAVTTDSLLHAHGKEWGDGGDGGDGKPGVPGENGGRWMAPSIEGWRRLLHIRVRAPDPSLGAAVSLPPRPPSPSCVSSALRPAPPGGEERVLVASPSRLVAPPSRPSLRPKTVVMPVSLSTPSALRPALASSQGHSQHRFSVSGRVERSTVLAVTGRMRSFAGAPVT